ncbi:MAG: fused MFS/spermidine synthase [Planctomycetales bacterium]|nr:fused MFS/spermidine synthase [Planctomycetales bacterium]
MYRRPINLGFAFTIFWSAFLLFQVQPLIGKYILPWFGGTPAVWSTCMLFFQALLFLGYAYAHFLSGRTMRTQLFLHGALIGLAFFTLPISPAETWKPDGSEEPVGRILLLLLMNVGLPYFILSSTGPLLQNWFSHHNPGKSPYRLYALSNCGSLLALISYPFVVERTLAVSLQAALWSTGFVIFGAACLVCAVVVTWGGPSMRKESSQSLSDAGRSVPAPRWSDRLLWFALAMAASLMLLATTNQVCLDVAAVPFLWVLPLTLYLLTFILCFDSDRWYSRRVFAWMLAVAVVSVSLMMLHGVHRPIVQQVTVYFTGMFFCCMVCHGELARMKPDPRYLTSFYLTLAGGGAAGGILVGFIAPYVFPAYLEMHLGLVCCAVVVLTVYFRDRSWHLYNGRPAEAWFGISLAMLWLTLTLTADAHGVITGSRRISRSFYGVLRVQEKFRDDPEQHRIEMVHGRVVHGLQFVSEHKRMMPTAYYHERSGVGRALRNCQASGPVHVGVVGLGAGTLATYGRAGDRFRFYEINPDVIRLAQEEFTYLSESQAEITVDLGDGRLSLEHEASNAFDLLVIDAFSGDAIPTHLLTGEALEVYRKHLKRDGILAIHYSNLHFDLEPVIAGLAESGGLQFVSIKTDRDVARGHDPAHWALLMDRSEPDVRQRHRILLEDATSYQDATLHWTDERCNLFEVLR